jgi:hypothetical protein
MRPTGRGPYGTDCGLGVGLANGAVANGSEEGEAQEIAETGEQEAEELGDPSRQR